mmetsp:Transcript_19828/g.46104  ORF Transcript_19828/g.46104 Transcript_19828/m.46104 type:complete len:290 (-) Transcript_19828:218-1087(-)|eukprot:CAMPEP_0178387832 /NCGR_PEP_ID=MMETSP0689_2-20121128/9278_1 /TAXON_ID=160604 /ORGANISM="Amphidinium massartii, Strain CS-259" /LENGTH=289 /DNA_ID=CAMNT_0020008211 /DNA_START=23 /DNA_END=892 /DNA_ORIENTATION=-
MGGNYSRKSAARSRLEVYAKLSREELGRLGMQSRTCPARLADMFDDRISDKDVRRRAFSDILDRLPEAWLDAHIEQIVKSIRSDPDAGVCLAAVTLLEKLSDDAGRKWDTWFIQQIVDVCCADYVCTRPQDVRQRALNVMRKFGDDACSIHAAELVEAYLKTDLLVGKAKQELEGWCSDDLGAFLLRISPRARFRALEVLLEKGFAAKLNALSEQLMKISSNEDEESEVRIHALLVMSSLDAATLGSHTQQIMHVITTSSDKAVSAQAQKVLEKFEREQPLPASGAARP